MLHSIGKRQFAFSRLLEDRLRLVADTEPYRYAEAVKRWGFEGLAARMAHNAAVGAVYMKDPAIRATCLDFGIAANSAALKKVLLRGENA